MKVNKLLQDKVVNIPYRIQDYKSADYLIGKIKELLDRLEGVKEIIVATNTTMEGEATAMYIKQKVKEINPSVQITRIARGLPMGADLEYADSITLQSAMEGRKIID